MKKIAYKEIATHFSVSVGSIQLWEKSGFLREWPIEQQEKWRAVHLELRGEQMNDKWWTTKWQLREKADIDASEQPMALAIHATFNEARVAKIRKEVERLEIKIQRERSELVLAAEVQEAFTRILSIWCSEIDALVNDLPGQIGGLSENEMLPKLKSRGEMLKRNAGQAISMLP